MTEKSITTFLMARRVSFCLSWAVKSLVYCDGTLGLATEPEESLGHVLADRAIVLLEPEYMTEWSWMHLDSSHPDRRTWK